MLTAAVASMVAKNGAYLRACLEQTGLVKMVADWGIEAERHPAAGESVPDVVIIDLTRDQNACFEFAAHLRKLRPSMCLMACSPVHEPSSELLVQVMRSGMREFLPQPIDAGALQEALERYIKDRGPSAEPEALDKLTVVMGSKGGVGTTTVAVNLAVQLATLTRKRVVLLDFARPLGHVALLLDLRPRFSIRDAVENLDRLDSHFFSGLLTHHKSGLEVLAGTSDPDEWFHIPVPVLPRVVNVAQSSCEYLLMDLGSVYSSEWSSVLHLARAMVVVAQADVPALWTLERHVAAMKGFGLDVERLRIVINRWHRSDDEALKAFEKKVKCPLFARVPNDFRQVSDAVNLGTPLSRNHQDPLMSRFRQMASQLSGLTPAALGKRGGTILNLFGQKQNK